MALLLTLSLALLNPNFIFAFSSLQSLSLLPSNLTRPSFFSNQLPTFRGHCVNKGVFPGWTGTLNSDDCSKTQMNIEDLAAPILDKRFTFWAQDIDGSTSKPADGWELPEGVIYGSLIWIPFPFRREWR